MPYLWYTIWIKTKTRYPLPLVCNLKITNTYLWLQYIAQQTIYNQNLIAYHHDCKQTEGTKKQVYLLGYFPACGTPEQLFIDSLGHTEVFYAVRKCWSQWASDSWTDFSSIESDCALGFHQFNSSKKTSIWWRKAEQQGSYWKREGTTLPFTQWICYGL